jgi:hypothetical protein
VIQADTNKNVDISAGTTGTAMINFFRDSIKTSTLPYIYMDNSIASSTMAKSNTAGTNTASLTFADSTLTYGSIWGTSNSTSNGVFINVPISGTKAGYVCILTPNTTGSGFFINSGDIGTGANGVEIASFTRTSSSISAASSITGTPSTVATFSTSSTNIYVTAGGGNKQSTTTPVLGITGNGLGIGTASPTMALDVRGDAVSSNVVLAPILVANYNISQGQIKLGASASPTCSGFLEFIGPGTPPVTSPVTLSYKSYGIIYGNSIGLAINVGNVDAATFSSDGLKLYGGLTFMVGTAEQGISCPSVGVFQMVGSNGTTTIKSAGGNNLTLTAGSGNTYIGNNLVLNNGTLKFGYLPSGEIYYNIGTLGSFPASVANITNVGSLGAYNIWNLYTPIGGIIGCYNNGYVQSLITWYPGTVTIGNVNDGTSGHLNVYGNLTIRGTVNGSDKRIKTNINNADTTVVLNKINELPLKTYNFIETNHYSDDLYYGLIAQNIKNIFPEAVKITENNIPCVYKLASSVILLSNNTDVQITVDIPDTTSLQVGLQIKLRINGSSEMILTNILSFTSTQMIVTVWTDFDASKSVFVYGIYVNDFHMIDKSYLALISFGGIQELSKRNDALTAQVSALQLQVTTLMEQMATVLAKN